MDDINEEREQEDLSELISLLKLHNLASHPKQMELLDDEKSGLVSIWDSQIGPIVLLNISFRLNRFFYSWWRKWNAGWDIRYGETVSVHKNSKRNLQHNHAHAI